MEVSKKSLETLREHVKTWDPLEILRVLENPALDGFGSTIFPIARGEALRRMRGWRQEADGPDDDAVAEAWAEVDEVETDEVYG